MTKIILLVDYQKSNLEVNPRIPYGEAIAEEHTRAQSKTGSSSLSEQQLSLTTL